MNADDLAARLVPVPYDPRGGPAVCPADTGAAAGPVPQRSPLQPRPQTTRPRRSWALLTPSWGRPVDRSLPIPAYSPPVTDWFTFLAERLASEFLREHGDAA